jgi:HrpA-like RNA helicase
LIVSARVRLHLLYAVEKYRTVVIVGETGSGKSTQIPQVMIHTHTREGTHDST